jgi:oxygen-dependent protoporphyrinogen oxidase
MGIPADVAVATGSGLLSRTGGVRAQLDRWLPGPGLEADIGVGRLVSRRVGAEVRDRLVEPMLGGVYAGRSDDISLQAALPQVAAQLRGSSRLLAAAGRVMAESAGSTGAGKVPVFAGIEGGVGRLPVEVARAISRLGAVVRCSSLVRRLDRTPSGWRLVVGSTARPEGGTADAVIVATPAAAAARLLTRTSPQAAHELGGIEYASVAIVTVAMAAADVSIELPGSGFLVPPIERRVVKAATYSTGKWGWLSEDLVIIRCSIGRHRDEAELQRDDTELVKSVVVDLHDATGLRAPLLDAGVTRWGGGLPQYAVGHLDRVRRIRAAVAGVPGLEICGAALDGVGIPAVIATGQQAAARVIEHLTEPGQWRHE